MVGERTGWCAPIRREEAGGLSRRGGLGGLGGGRGGVDWGVRRGSHPERCQQRELKQTWGVQRSKRHGQKSWWTTDRKRRLFYGTIRTAQCMLDGGSCGWRRTPQEDRVWPGPMLERGMPRMLTPVALGMRI